MRAGFVRAYHNAIERGKLNFSVVNQIRIVKVLGAEVGDLFPPISELAEEDEQNETDEDTDRGTLGDTKVSEPEANAYQIARTVGAGGPLEPVESQQLRGQRCRYYA